MTDGVMDGTVKVLKSPLSYQTWDNGECTGAGWPGGADVILYSALPCRRAAHLCLVLGRSQRLDCLSKWQDRLVDLSCTLLIQIHLAPVGSKTRKAKVMFERGSVAVVD